MKKLILASMVVLGMAVSIVNAGQVAANHGEPHGNNGTLKIHEQGTPEGTPNNDPKVCVFNVEAFGLDAGQSGYLQFDVQGGDGPTGTPAGPFAFGPAGANGYFASQYFNLANGHYKATLYGKQLPNGALEDVKAKSKVFKVECKETPPVECPEGQVEDEAGNCITPGKGGGKPEQPNKPSQPSTTPSKERAAPVSPATPESLPVTGGLNTGLMTAIGVAVSSLIGAVSYGVRFALTRN